MNTLDKFEMIGTRLTACDFREDVLLERIRSDGDGGAIQMGFNVDYDIGEAAISKGSLGSRNVIEVPFTFKLEGRLRTSKEPVNLGTMCELSFVSGFVGKDENNDGDLSLFSDCIEIVSRTIFWSVRTYIQSFINITLMRNIPIPWDLTPQKPKLKRSAKKATKPKLTKDAASKLRTIAPKAAKAKVRK